MEGKKETIIKRSLCRFFDQNQFFFFSEERTSGTCNNIPANANSRAAFARLGIVMPIWIFNANLISRVDRFETFARRIRADQRNYQIARQKREKRIARKRGVCLQGKTKNDNIKFAFFSVPQHFYGHCESTSARKKNYISFRNFSYDQVFFPNFYNIDIYILLYSPRDARRHERISVIRERSLAYRASACAARQIEARARCASESSHMYEAIHI